MWSDRLVPAAGLRVITSYTTVVSIFLNLRSHTAGYGIDRGAGLRFLKKAKSLPFPPLLTGSRTKPPSNSICNGVLYPVAKWPGRAAVNLLSTNCDVQNAKYITLILSVEEYKIAHGSGTFDAKFAVTESTSFVNVSSVKVIPYIFQGHS